MHGDRMYNSHVTRKQRISARVVRFFLAVGRHTAINVPRLAFGVQTYYLSSDTVLAFGGGERGPRLGPRAYKWGLALMQVKMEN